MGEQIDLNHNPGGTGTGAEIPYGRQWIDEDDIQAVVEVLRSEWLTQGPKVREFEKKFARYVGARYAVAVSSGTAALHITCWAAGIGPGDEVITSPVTFVATAHAALHCRARPVFVDIDPDTICLDPRALEAYLEARKAPGVRPLTRPRAVVPVHFAGVPCDMPRIGEIARKHNMVVIEDACHALGARYRGMEPGSGADWIKVGGCTHSDMTVFSFHPVKHITTGEGGMVTTNSPEFYKKLLMYRNHGITRRTEDFSGTMPFEPHLSKRGERRSEAALWYYEMQALGLNYRITDIQCALGISQLGKLDAFVHKRREIARRYNSHFREVAGLELPPRPPQTEPSFHLYVLRLKRGSLHTRFRVLTGLMEQGIRAQVHYIPVHRQPFFKKGVGKRASDLRHADAFYTKCLSLPLFPRMKEEEVQRVVEGVLSLAPLFAEREKRKEEDLLLEGSPGR